MTRGYLSDTEARELGLNHLTLPIINSSLRFKFTKVNPAYLAQVLSRLLDHQPQARVDVNRDVLIHCLMIIEALVRINEKGEPHPAPGGREAL